jgi:hypothetical protein
VRASAVLNNVCRRCTQADTWTITSFTSRFERTILMSGHGKRDGTWECVKQVYILVVHILSMSKQSILTESLRHDIQSW